jgi:hypothetical protein
MVGSNIMSKIGNFGFKAGGNTGEGEGASTQRSNY